MTATELLKRKRRDPFANTTIRARTPWDSIMQGNDALGSTQPDIDPIMILAGLLGPGLMRQILPKLAGRLGSQAAGPVAQQAPQQAAPQGFSQKDMLLARLQAQGRQQQAVNKIPDFASKLESGGVKTLPSMHPDTIPPAGITNSVRGKGLSDRTLWDYIQPKPGSKLAGPNVEDFLTKYGTEGNPGGPSSWAQAWDRSLIRTYNMSGGHSPEGIWAQYFKATGMDPMKARLAAWMKHAMSEEGSGMDAVAALKRMRQAAKN